MSDYNVTAILSAKDRGYTSQMKAALGQLEELQETTITSSESMTKMGAAFGAAAKVMEAALSAVKSSVGSAVKRFDTLTQFPKIMEQLGFSADDASKATEKLSEGIQGLPTSLSEITANTQSLALLSGDLEEAADLAIALNDAFLASGASSADAARGLTQYTQMMSAGKVDMQSWKTLLETMGVALNDVAAEFGYTGASAKNDLYEALKAGTVTFDDVNKCLINLDNGLSSANDSFVSFSERALTSSEGIATSMQNIQTAITAGLANVINSIDSAMQAADLGSISSNLNSLKGVISSLFTTISNMASSIVSTVAPVFKNLSENMDLVAISVGALVAKFTALKVIDTVKSKIKDFKTATKNSADTIKKYNSLLDQYGTKQKAVVAAEEAATKAKELANKATVAQEEATRAILDAKQKALDAQKLENSAASSSLVVQEKRNAALEANAAAMEAQVAAEQKKIEAERLDMEATQAAAQAEQKQADAATLNNTQISLKSALMSVLSGQTSIATAAQEAFNAALKSNPIGFVITAVTTLISVFSGLAAIFGSQKTEAEEYAESQKEVRKALEESEEALKKSKQEHENNITATKQDAAEASKLVSEIESLYRNIKKETAAGNDCADMKAKLKKKISQLNSVLGDTAYAYDETTNALSSSTKEMQAYVKQATKNAEVNELLAIQSEEYDNLTEAQTAVTNAQNDLNAATDAAAQAWDDYYKVIEDSNSTWAETEQALYDRDAALAECEAKEKEAQATLDEWQPKLAEFQSAWAETSANVVTAQDELKASEESYNAILESTANDYAMLEAAATQAAATQYQTNQEMLESGKLTYSELSEANQKLVDGLQTTWDNYYDTASNLWKVLKDEETVSVDEMIANLQKNQQTVQEMGNNLGTLRDRFASLGLDTAVLDQLENMGVEASSDIEQLVGASDEQLQGLATAFGNAATTSTDALTNGLGTAAAANVPDAVKNMVDTMKQGLSEQIAAADWAELGEAQIQGIVEGVEGMTDDAMEASENAAKEGYKTYQKTIQSGSPSKIYAGFGEDQMTGIIQGVNRTKGRVTSLMSNVATQMQSSYKNLKSTFQSYGAYTMTGFINGLNSQRSSVIATANSIAKAASDTVQSALKIGSPSKLMYQYGAWTGEGLENGLESREKSIKKIASKIATTMANIFIPTMSDYSYQGELAVAGGLTYSMDSIRDDIGELADSINSRPIIIQNDLAVDGRSFAKSTTAYITREQESQTKINQYIRGTK